MKSDLPKVLCSVLGRPMIEFVLDALQAGGVEQVIAVVGYRASDVRQQLVARKNVRYVEQTERLGTGHAVKMAREQIAAHRGPVLVVAGDSPMIQAESVRRLLAAFGSAGASPSQFGSAGASPSQKTACLLGTLHKDNPYGLGRIVRDATGEFAGIVEEKDATEEQRKITEVNMSTYVFDAQELVHALDRLKNDNRQKEYYLTDCPGILRQEGKAVKALPVLQACEALSINTPEELSAVEEKLREMGYK